DARELDGDREVPALEAAKARLILLRHVELEADREPPDLRVLLADVDVELRVVNHVLDLVDDGRRELLRTRGGDRAARALDDLVEVREQLPNVESRRDVLGCHARDGRVTLLLRVLHPAKS